MKKYLFISFFILSVFTSTAQNNDWKIEANNTTNYVGTPVANGGIGILPWSEPFRFVISFLTMYSTAMAPEE